MLALLNRIMSIDRRWIFLLIGVGTALPILFPIGFRVSVTPSVSALYDRIEKMEAGQVILVSFDYGPSTAPENDPMADAVLRHAFSKKLRVVILALYPIGGLAMADQSLARVTPDFPGLTYGVDYVHLGYKSGGQASMKQIGEEIRGVFPTDRYGTPLETLPLMAEVHNYDDMRLVVSFATGIIGEWWANLINAQFHIPVAVGCTAVSAPKYYAFLQAGQMVGLLGGLKGASEYEALLLGGYPNFHTVYDRAGLYTAIKGMDAQTIDHTVILVFIILGNLAFVLGRRRTRFGGTGR
ncbi:MAG: hypothetical protein ACE15D_05990 [Candidatus Eisenbacteria bacterium]|nr:hypothetical protein [Candidatus Eisenbacteria bacterium]